MDILTMEKFKKMNSAFDESVKNLQELLEKSDNEQVPRGLRRGETRREVIENSSSSEEEERPRRKKRKGRSHSRELSPSERKKLTKSYIEHMRRCNLQKAKEGRPENQLMISKIEGRLNKGLHLDKEMLHFLGVRHHRRLVETLAKSVTGETGASAFEFRDLINRELVRDNPGTYTPSGKVPGGNFPMTITDSEQIGQLGRMSRQQDGKTIMDREAERINSQFRPEQQPPIGKLVDRLAEQGRVNYQYTPIGSNTPVPVSGRTILERLILLTKLKKNFLNAEQVTTLESLINKGKPLNPELLRKLFSPDTLL